MTSSLLPASPLTFLQARPVGKITLKEKSGGVSQSAHNGKWHNLTSCLDDSLRFFPLFPFKNYHGGLPWWRSGWESACQCRGHGFDPWSGRIPHTAEQLGPWATTTEPARLEPVPHNKRGRDSERPAHRDEEWPQLATTRESPRTGTKTQHSQK